MSNQHASKKSKEADQKTKPSALKLCAHGVSCKHLAKGECKFYHPSQGKSPATKHQHVNGKLVVRHSASYMKAVTNLARAKSLVAGYIRVDSRDAKTASWADVDEVETLTQQVAFMRTAARMAIGGQKIRISLFFTNTISSGAGAAIAGYYGIIPSSSGEWASLISLYDECRVDSFDIKHIVGITAAPASAAAGSIVPYAIGYDPTFNTVPTSVQDVQESQDHSLHVASCALGFSQPVCPVGYHQFRVKVPHDGTVVNDDMKAKPNFPGSWTSCLDTADSFGYIRYYVIALPASGITAYYQNMQVNMEFRIRT